MNEIITAVKRFFEFDSRVRIEITNNNIADSMRTTINRNITQMEVKFFAHGKTSNGCHMDYEGAKAMTLESLSQEITNLIFFLSNLEPNKK